MHEFPVFVYNFHNVAQSRQNFAQPPTAQLHHLETLTIDCKLQTTPHISKTTNRIIQTANYKLHITDYTLHTYEMCPGVQKYRVVPHYQGPTLDMDLKWTSRLASL